MESRRWPCQDGDVLGRAGTVAAEELRLVSVLSRRHLVVQRRGGAWQAVALPDARNETFFDGRPMRRGAPYPLSGIHDLRVDDFEFHLGVADGMATQYWSGAVDSSVLQPLPSLHPPAPGPPDSPEGAGGIFLADLPVPALETDARLHILEANERALALLGSDAVGRDLDEWPEVPSQLREALLTLEPGEKGAPFVLRLSVRGRTARVELAATRGVAGFLVILRDVTAEAEGRGGLERTTDRLARQAEVLAELAVSPAFRGGDVAQGLTLLTHRAAEALGCSRVSVWLRETAANVGARRIVCRAVHGSAGSTALVGATSDLAYCPAFFDQLLGDDASATADADSPCLPILREISLAAADTASLLCVGLRDADSLPGLLVFERAAGARTWSPTDRQFALCLASQGMLALQMRERHETLARVEESGRRLTEELEEANRYVQRILPAPIEVGPITAEWNMQPSEALGGDSFGYHWVGDLFVMYVLDVVGHGTGMALLSISVLNNVRARLLMGEAAMADPAGVLRDLNAAFPMENQNQMLFSMWYGVYDTRTRRLTYASAGHPPAILLHAESAATDYGEDWAALGTEGPSIGAMEGVEYASGSVDVQPGAKLYIYTDGAFALPVASGREWTFDEFVAVLRSTRYMAGGETAYLRKRISSLCALPRFPDDFTIVRFSFES